MKHHPSWLAAGLVLFVVLACNLGKKSTNVNSNSNQASSSTPEATQGSGQYIKEVHMAKDNGRGAPGDETDSFAPDDRTVHCVVTLKEPKAETQMMFTWWAVDTVGHKNEKIKDISYSTKPRENIIHGHLSYPQDWPTGKYKVQIFVNGDLDKTVPYNIE
jgi:hypothetical protein